MRKAVLAGLACLALTACAVNPGNGNNGNSPLASHSLHLPPIACHPLRPGEPTPGLASPAVARTCYRAGERCPPMYHGLAGIAVDGRGIICRNRNGWRWEPA
jgi:hypothetical protein